MGVKDKTIANNQRVSALDSYAFGLEALQNITNNPLQRSQSISSETLGEERFRSTRYPTKGRVSIKIFHEFSKISVIILLFTGILIAVAIGIALYYHILPGSDSPIPNAFPMNPPSRYLITYNRTGVYSIGTIK